MCTNGVNTQQLKDTVNMIDETMALSRRWTHRMYHLASDGQMDKTAMQLQKIQLAIDDIREMLTETQDAIEADDANSGVTVTAV